MIFRKKILRPICFILALVSFQIQAFAGNLYYDLTSGQATDFMKSLLATVEMPWDESDPLAFHIENLNMQFQSHFFNPDVNYYDRGEALRYFSRFKPEDGVKIASKYLNLIYRVRKDIHPLVDHEYSHGIVATGEVEPSIRKRLVSLRSALMGTAELGRISIGKTWMLVGLERTRAILEKLLESEEFAPIRGLTEIEIILVGSDKNTGELGLKMIRDRLDGKRIVISDATFGTKMQSLARTTLEDSTVELYVKAITDWRFDMSLYHYVENYHGDEATAIMAWA